MRSLITPRFPSDGKAYDIYGDLIERVDGDIEQPHLFVRTAMALYEQHFAAADRSVHGRIFEFIIGEILLQNGVRPLYYQAQLLHVPLAKFDWFLYHPTHPVSLSCKTKARDRWKQAAYEAMALKRVYAQATNYLITIEALSATEQKKQDAPQTIDHFVQAETPEFDKVVQRLVELNFYKAKAVEPILQGKLVDIQQTENDLSD